MPHLKAICIFYIHNDIMFTSAARGRITGNDITLTPFCMVSYWNFSAIPYRSEVN